MLDDFFIEQYVATTMTKNAINKNTVTHAYLIETGSYYRGFDFAKAFAKSLLCPKKQTGKSICGTCTQCDRIDNKSFPELVIIEPDGLWIKKEQLDSLQKKFSTKSIEGAKKVYIINHAERLNVSAANSILKFLEEPEENIIAILVVNNVYSLLETIVSRCQLIKLNYESHQIQGQPLREKISNFLSKSKISWK